jgi:hypothetical protein
MNDLQKIKMLIVGLAEYLQLTLSQEQVVMYANELERDGVEFVGRAIQSIQKHPHNFYGKFPLPSQLREIAKGNDEDFALEASLKIIKSVSRYGYPNPTEARAFIGELGWSVVQAYGGWTTVCQIIDSPEKIGIIQSQFKKSAQMMLSRSRLDGVTGPMLIHESIRERLNDNSKEKESVSLGAVIGGFLSKDPSSQTGDL